MRSPLAEGARPSRSMGVTNHRLDVEAKADLVFRDIPERAPVAQSQERARVGMSHRSAAHDKAQPEQLTTFNAWVGCCPERWQRAHGRG